MAIKRHKPEEIVAKLRQVEVLVGQGMARIDAIREISIGPIPGTLIPSCGDCDSRRGLPNGQKSESIRRPQEVIHHGCSDFFAGRF